MQDLLAQLLWHNVEIDEAAGYINYCANAEYIKGRGDGKFYPQDKVTGYEALAMILRVVGYDKNGEFTGADWQVQTAATANQRKVTKNVNAGTLGNPASRETVAELLCQAILIEKVNYTLAFGYQISTDPKDTIAYETFKMEKLEGVVTGNEIADLKESSPLTAGQTRLVIDGREEIVDIPTTLDKIGKSVRAYIRPQGGTTRKQLVTDDVYDTELNNVYDSFASVSSVGNSTGSAEGITSIAGAEHYINYDYVTRWTARMRITYVMDLKWTEYQAFSMRKDNGGKLYAYRPADMANPGNEVSFGDDRSQWNTRLPHDGYTFTYVKTIALDDELTSQDWENLKTLFTNADKTGTSIVMGEVYVGTASFNNAQKDVSDEIRWEDFVNTYLKSEENKDQIDSNGQGFLLKIIDNDMDGIAEYVLQTRYTVAKVAANGTGLDIANLKLTDSDICNEVTASDKITVVSGTNLEASEDTVAAGDVVIYAMIDGVVRGMVAGEGYERLGHFGAKRRAAVALARAAAPPAAEAQGEVGMDQPREERAQQARAKQRVHRLQKPLALDAHVVAVRDEDALRAERQHLRRGTDLHAAFARQVVGHPHVVVAREEEDADAAVGQLGQLAERADEALGDHAAVFEPEIEEVAQ